MAWSGYNTRKQSDAKLKKTAKMAQGWLQRGFTPEEVATGIWNKVGYTASSTSNSVKIWGYYNDETAKDQRVRCEITSEGFDVK